MIRRAGSDEQNEWLAGLQVSDELAFTSMYKHFWPSLYSLAYNYVRDRAIAEEMVQELFTTLWLKRLQLNIQGSLEGYLFRAIRNMIYDHIEKQTVRVRVHDQLKYLGMEGTYTTDETITFDELQSQLIQAVNQLPQPTQTIFRLSRFDHMPVADIADQVHLSPKAIEYHITRALKLLRLHLKDFLPLLVLTTLH